MMHKLIALLTLSLSVLAQTSDLAVTEPSADHWWVAQSLNTLKWTGSTPSQFSVFLNNPNPSVLTSKYALISIEELYQFSQTINPGAMTPATGYTIELTDILNSSNIYATSQEFEIKAVGSTYPAQTTPSASGAIVVSGTGGAAATSAAASQSAQASNAATPGSQVVGAGLVGAVLGGLGLLL